MKKIITLLSLTLALAFIPVLQAADWKETLKTSLPLLGHRNWIVVADAAYPWQVSPGVQTVPTGATQEEVTKAVLKALAATKHVKPTIYLDQELAYVPEDTAPGISTYREKLAGLLAGAPISRLPHDHIIAKLDGAGKTFQILLLKTNMTIPYTSVFFELECGYWDAASEKRLRELIPAK
jgi:hypothetical protein